MGQVGAWYRVSSVFNWCGALFLCSKFCGVSCCAGCVGVGIESFSILGVVFFIVVASAVLYLIRWLSYFLGVSSAAIVMLQFLV